MADLSTSVVERLDSVIDDFNESSNSQGFIEPYDARRVATRSYAAIERYAPAGSPYVSDARVIAERDDVSDGWKAEQFAAIAHALRDDYAWGELNSVEELVHADLFDDFLGMSDELLDKGFVGPAAVVAGSVLEEHLRKLALKNDIALTEENERPRTVDRLSSELRKANIFSEVQRKSIASWYAQRTEGAHGRIENLDASDVRRMIDSVRDFLPRYSA